MAPCPGTDHTASSANSPRSARPSFRANASKIRRTIASFSAAGPTGLPPWDESLDVAALCVRERGEPDQAPHLGRVVVLDRGLQVLALRSRLAQLSAEPAQQAHGGLIRHAGRLAVCGLGLGGVGLGGVVRGVVRAGLAFALGLG